MECVQEKGSLDSVSGVVLWSNLDHLYISIHYASATLPPKHNGSMNLASAMDDIRAKAV
jgi:hypothetical protein